MDSKQDQGATHNIQVRPQEECFAVRLRERRKEKRWSQGGLSDRTGILGTSISHFETGRRMPGLTNLLGLADALDTSVDYLMGRTDNPAVHRQANRYLRGMSIDDERFLMAFAERLRQTQEPDEDTPFPGP